MNRTSSAGPFTPARNFDAVENVPNWKDIDPRFGVVWDLFGDGKTAIKASVGRYVVRKWYTIARAVNRCSRQCQLRRPDVDNSSRCRFTTGTYNPYNDCDLFNPAANTKRPGQIQCGAINNRRLDR